MEVDMLTGADEGIEGVGQVNNAVTSLIDQFATIKFEGLLMYGVLMALAVVLCLEGYRLYKLALLMIGFVVGYTQAHYLIDLIKIQLSNEQMLMAQGIAGIVCAIFTAAILRFGVFIVTFYLFRYGLAMPISVWILGLFSKNVKLPELLVPAILTVLSVVVAVFAAKLAVNALRPTIVILTAAFGAFMTVNCFIAIIPLFPYNLSFMPASTSMIWAFVKLGLTAAGVGIQDIHGEE